MRFKTKRCEIMQTKISFVLKKLPKAKFKSVIKGVIYDMNTK